MQPGQSIVIIGASSGTGLMGVQIAKAFGAARVLRMGADEVVDYSKESWWEKSSLCDDLVDIVCVTFSVYFNHLFRHAILCFRYDCVGGQDTWTRSHFVLKPGGKFVTIAGDEQSPLRPLKLLSLGVSILGRKIASFAGSPAYAARSDHRCLRFRLAHHAETGTTWSVLSTIRTRF
jgi:NADPH:quinone reductase-like Zn-dependent oxidoreductase